ncbi:MarR family winged helix-turn-helix transcriptional regulator [Gordonia sp. NPDC058843]|uniref:MarR family winged helix-turn-helix transcriptional regulator n=1 Tax=Gordonia sp. NPDC058843 TaxID=3346648 RepID=UPI0036C97A97
MTTPSIPHGDDGGNAVGRSSDDLGEEIIIALLRVINKIQIGRRTPHTYGEEGVSMTLVEAEMCALIFRNQGITGGELSTQLGVTRSATSQVVGKLKDKGFVIDVLHPGDAKRRRLYLTDSGKVAASVADEYSKKLRHEVFNDDIAEMQAYRRFLTKLEAFHDQVTGQRKL